MVVRRFRHGFLSSRLPLDVFQDGHSQNKHRRQQAERLDKLYRLHLGIKLITWEDGQQQWMGCAKVLPAAATR